MKGLAQGLGLKLQVAGTAVLMSERDFAKLSRFVRDLNPSPDAEPAAAR